MEVLARNKAAHFYGRLRTNTRNKSLI